MNRSALIVDLDRHAAEALRNMLESAGWEARAAYSTQEISAMDIGLRFHVILADPRFPADGSAGIMDALMQRAPHARIVALLDRSDSAFENAILSTGVAATLVKPYGKERVAALLERFSREEQRDFDFMGMIGSSGKMLKLYETLRAVAGTDSTALIQGETGVGKEMVAAAIHRLSRRSHKRFLTINCGALSETLLESELFGHEKGAFTGALKLKPGKFEVASGGTVFLDEIGEISPAVQVKVLKVIETGEVERLGGNDVIKTDVRMIFATNRDLLADVKEGRFRRDLYYRINAFPIHVPPLRERREDIPALAERFLEIYSLRHGGNARSLSPEAFAWLMDGRWEGNVRELANVIERAVIVAGSQVVAVSDLSATGDGPEPDEMEGLAGLTYRQMRKKALDVYERKYFTELLSSCGGGVSASAGRAGLDRKTFYAKLAALGLDPKDFRAPKK
jgi:two-component system response regulator HydG